jgi:hypothetical protein
LTYYDKPPQKYAWTWLDVWTEIDMKEVDLLK